MYKKKKISDSGRRYHQKNYCFEVKENKKQEKRGFDVSTEPTKGLGNGSQALFVGPTPPQDR